MFFFLPAQYRSQRRNLTSDEAEISLLNKGFLFYIDWEKSKIFFRKQYKDCSHITQHYTEVYVASDLTINEHGEITDAFLEAYAYLQQMNEMLWESQNEREEMAYMIEKQIEDHLNSWDWN